MATRTTIEERDRERERERGADRGALVSSMGKFLLGLGVVGPGLTLLAYQQADYALVPYVCAGVRAWILFHVLAVVALVVLAVLGLIAWRNWRLAGGDWHTERGTVPSGAAFVSILGFVSAAFFALVVLAMWAAHFFLHPCQ